MPARIPKEIKVVKTGESPNRIIQLIVTDGETEVVIAQIQR